MNILFEHVSAGYQEGIDAVSDLSLAIPEGAIVLITGANGAGKSTFLKLLNGILKPRTGRVCVGQLDTRSISTSELSRHIAVTFQNPSDQIFSSNVRDEVAFGPRVLKRPAPLQTTDQVLDLLGLRQYSAKHPYDVSPAHRKLLTIASAIAADTPILAFDEPTAGLSQPERVFFANAIALLNARHRTLIVVSHDLEYFLPVATLLVILRHGRIMFCGEPRAVHDHSSLAKRAGIRMPASMRFRALAERRGTKNQKGD